MSEDLQHIDELFRDAFENNEEIPSPNIRQSLIAHLDNEDAVTYKRKFIAVKRIAIMLIFLLLSLVIYETRSDRNGHREMAGKEKSKANDFKSHNNDINKKEKSVTLKTRENRETSATEKRNLPDFFFIKSDSTKSLPSKQNNIQAISSLQPLERKISITKPLFTNTKRAYNNNEKNNFINKFTFSANDISAHKNKKHSLHSRLNNIDERSVTVFTTSNGDKETAGVAERRSDYKSRILLPLILSFVKGNTGLIINDSEKKYTFSNLPLSDSAKLAIAKANIQKKKPRTYFKPYWELTAIATQEWAQYNLENDIADNTGNQQNEKSQIEQRENHEPSFSAGVLASYQFKKHWAIQTGLVYSNTAISIDPQKIYAATEANGTVAYKYNSSSGYAFVKPNFGLPPAVGDSLSTSASQHNLQYLSIPVLLKYKLTSKKLSVSPGIGFSANFLTSATIQTEVEDALNKEAVTISRLEGTRFFYAGLIANADIQYKFTRNVSLNFIPSFRYAITPVTKNNVVKTFPYSFGLGLGLTYKF